MNNPFYQPKVIYQLSFQAKFKYISCFEKFFEENENILGISTHEIQSETIETLADDIWIIEVLLNSRPDQKQFIKDLNDYALANNLYFKDIIQFKEIVDQDWVAEYQKQLKPIIIDDFYITSTSINKNCPPNLTPIYIEASRAFGTGDHSTTSLCVKSMSLIKNQNINNIFDIGTGSGILSFVAEKIWPSAQILACDIESVSIEIANNNLVANNSKVKFYQNSEQSLDVPASNNKFDLIISNILAPVLINLSSIIKSMVNDGGYVILSGFLDYQSQNIIDIYTSHGFNLVKELDENRWKTLTFKLK